MVLTAFRLSSCAVVLNPGRNTQRKRRINSREESGEGGCWRTPFATCTIERDAALAFGLYTARRVADQAGEDHFHGLCDPHVRVTQGRHKSRAIRATLDGRLPLRSVGGIRFRRSQPVALCRAHDAVVPSFPPATGRKGDFAVLTQCEQWRGKRQHESCQQQDGKKLTQCPDCSDCRKECSTGLSK